ncbi:hypothetical protein A1OE_1096 [Candidatus Endolissoclinum faulkneri L2]|uniref:Uncharacterized protein n=1 Tax=Candidatus Endolissoclinum faulkneri L2 TaxID=1193729 RepID=K7YRU8_9PROT|nr:hypothetical protein A1OE_1096 [Candidatus Endolissoclinum faulkneri L2]
MVKLTSAQLIEINSSHIKTFSLLLLIYCSNCFFSVIFQLPINPI